MKATLHVLLLQITFITFAQSAKILGIFHGYSGSHQHLGNKILLELAARGHQVTAIVQRKFAPKTANENYQPIMIEYDSYLKSKCVTTNDPLFHCSLSTNLYKSAERGLLDTISSTAGTGLVWTELFFNQTSVQNLLKSNQEFDMVILEEFLNDAFKGFCNFYTAHCVSVSVVGPSRFTNLQMGNPLNPSYMPEILSRYSSEMSFFQRLVNTFSIFFGVINFYWSILPKHNEILQKNFPGSPPITELFYRTSLMLLNSHVSVSSPVPLVPNMIEIGGFHLNTPKELPRDLQNYLDEAENGVIYFSMGSNLRGNDVEESKRNAIIKVFSQLKQRVLWKWENDTIPGQPDNVKLGKWLPQQDILGHPNIKLFVTHGGLLSIIETIYHGVPIVGIPIFGDQEMNMAVVEADGYGKLLRFSALTEETFRKALTEVLNNDKYKENAIRRSRIMHDQPMKPLDRAMFWIEYVLRHEGAPHLRTGALNLNWFQVLCLDVLTVIILIVASFIFSTYCIINVVSRGYLKKQIKIKKR
uniref:UDP-glucuronosyltransferase n=1 Tax=Photinus pyralis TaxID=7054 RepID=A0A1Y1MYZ1_PHOPY